MRFRTGYFSFILAFFLCSAMLFMYVASSNASSEPAGESFLVEKRYYAVSDMEFSMYQVAGQALKEAKANVSAAHSLLMLASVFPQTSAVAKAGGQALDKYELEIAKYYVLWSLYLDSQRLKSIYGQDYAIAFWCGPDMGSRRAGVLDSMLKSATALPPVDSQSFDSVTGVQECSGYLSVDRNSATDEWALRFDDFAHAGALPDVPVKSAYDHVGIGLSIYDKRLNQSSIHSITRIDGVRAP